MIKYVYIFTVVALLSTWITEVLAATVKNTDLKVQSLVIVEGSTSSTISLNNNQTAIICIKGCFITFPNKDHFAVMADDNIEIIGGRAIFK